MGHNNQDWKVTWLDSNLVHESQIAAGRMIEIYTAYNCFVS